MSLFSNLFGDSNKVTNDSAVKWNALTQLKQLDDILMNSRHHPVFVFKHSTRCGISRMVLKDFEAHYDLTETVEPYFLDLLENRQISNEIADRLNVVHQSPQIILIIDEKCVYTASHSDIDASELGIKISEHIK